MLDLLEHYIYDSLPREDFATSPGLRRKVGPEGELLPFYGCTAVFWLPEAARRALSGLRRAQHQATVPLPARATPSAWAKRGSLWACWQSRRIWKRSNSAQALKL